MTVPEKEKMRNLERELATTKAELALAKAAYEGAVAKLGANDETDLTTKADEAWLRAREEAA